MKAFIEIEVLYYRLRGTSQKKLASEFILLLLLAALNVAFDFNWTGGWKAGLSDLVKARERRKHERERDADCAADASDLKGHQAPPSSRQSS